MTGERTKCKHEQHTTKKNVKKKQKKNKRNDKTGVTVYLDIVQIYTTSEYNNLIQKRTQI